MATIPEKLRELKLKGKTIGFFAKSGTVAGNKIWSETNVSSSYSALADAYKVSSSVTTNQDIWIRTDDGKEFKLDGPHIEVNAGHDVSVVYAGFNNRGWPVCLVNRTTSRWHSVYSAKWFVKKKLGITAVVWVWYVVPPVILVFASTLIQGFTSISNLVSGFIGVGLMLAPLVWMFRSLITDTIYRKKLQKHIGSIAQTLF